MGFWKNFLGISNSSKDVKNKKGNNNQNSFESMDFLTLNEEQEFKRSIYGKIQLLDSDVTYIKEVLPERGENLKKQINLLTELLEKSNDENDPDVQRVFQELINQFEEDKRMADGEYTLRELENQNKSMDAVFEKSDINKSELDEYIKYISKIQEKVSNADFLNKPLLTNVQRQKFNYISMKSEYRLRMLELMYLLENRNVVSENPFENLSETKQKMFSKFFYEDAEKASKQYDNLSLSEDLFRKMKMGFYQDSVDRIAKELNDLMANVTMIEDFSIKQLFDSKNPNSKSFEFLKSFVKFKSYLNLMREKRPSLIERRNKEEEQKRLDEEKRREEERSCKEKKDKMKNMSDNDIITTINSINNDLSATGSRFVNMLDFQKEVARAKGLLTNEEVLQNDLLVYKTVDPISLTRMIEKANTEGINYLVFPDIQENNDGNYLFIVSNSDKNITSLPVENCSIPNRLPHNNFLPTEKLGSYSALVLNRLQKKLKGTPYERIEQNLSAAHKKSGVYELEIGYVPYDGKPRDYNKRVYDAITLLEREYKDLEHFGENNQYLQNILCYIKVPATRNIIPILSKMQEAQIEPIFEPIADKNRNKFNRDDIHIYFRREELEKLKSEVLPKISNSDLGLATLKWDNNSLGKAIREFSSWPEEKFKVL